MGRGAFLRPCCRLLCSLSLFCFLLCGERLRLYLALYHALCPPFAAGYQV